jgi:hypothetical protein
MNLGLKKFKQKESKGEGATITPTYFSRDNDKMR